MNTDNSQESPKDKGRKDWELKKMAVFAGANLLSPQRQMSINKDQVSMTGDETPQI